MLHSRSAVPKPAESRANAFIFGGGAHRDLRMVSTAAFAIRGTGSPRVFWLPSAGSARDDGQRHVEQAPGDEATDAEGQRVCERRDEVGAAAIFHRDDRFSSHAGVAAECEHRHSRVDAGGYGVGLLFGGGQFVGAGLAPAGLRRAAAAAFQRQDQIEHACSVAVRGDRRASKRGGQSGNCTRRCVGLQPLAGSTGSKFGPNC